MVENRMFSFVLRNAQTSLTPSKLGLSGLVKHMGNENRTLRQSLGVVDKHDQRLR